MIREGDLVLFRFPQADLQRGKLRPALLLKEVPNGYGDWLVCMVSTQLHLTIEGLEIVISASDAEFPETGLKQDSLVRISRLAVVQGTIFEGKLGSISSSRLQEVKGRLASWIQGG